MSILKHLAFFIILVKEKETRMLEMCFLLPSTLTSSVKFLFRLRGPSLFLMVGNFFKRHTCPPFKKHTTHHSSVIYFIISVGHKYNMIM